MDFYLKVAFVLLAIIAVSTMIYLFMTNATQFQYFLERILGDIHTEITTVLDHDIEHFENSRAISGTVILPLIRDVGSHDLAIFVQTIAQNGTVVNYGVQLRGVLGNEGRDTASATPVPSASIHPELPAWEDDFVFSVRSVFGKGFGGGLLGGINIGSGVAANNMPALGRVASLNLLYNNGPAQPRIGLTVGDEPWYTPTIAFWDTSHSNFGVARDYGSTFTSSGRLYTVQSLMPVLPSNYDDRWATTPGNPYYISMTSFYHSAFIVDVHGLIVGIYFEEQGVHDNCSLLAQAQINSGMFERTLPHNN